MFDLKNQVLLVIAPHPDDEVIGCAGLIKKIKDAHGKVYVLYLTVGDTKDFSKTGLSTASQRKKEIEKVAKFLEFDNYDLALSGNDYHLKLDTLGQKALMGIVEKESTVSVEKVKPTIVAFPYKGSYNQDHRIAAYATHAALRPASTKLKRFVPLALSYESPAEHWSLGKQTINCFVPLSKKELEAKIYALKLYKSQVRQKPNPRSPEVLKTLARMRGYECATEFAESYTSYRLII